MSKPTRGCGRERRAQVRYSHALRTSCRPLGREGGSWPAEVRDVSRAGASLVMSREVRPGAVLVVALECLGGRFARPQLMRVARVRRDGERAWEVGCTFVTPLTDNDVQALLLVGEPAGAERAAFPF